MITGEQYFRDSIEEINIKTQELIPEKFEHPTDYAFNKASLEAQTTAYQRAFVEWTKIVKDSSPEEAAIMMHSVCKKLADDNRVLLSECERLQNQEDNNVAMERGRLNGLIDAYITIRIHFDAQTSQHAAQHERTKK